MHDRMYEARGLLGRDDLIGYARDLGLDADRVAGELDSSAHGPRVERDVESGTASGVMGTPGFFIGGRMHDGSFDAGSLIAALEASAG
jgi:2-hydroxychromene-2-carboxylate isomerase